MRDRLLKAWKKEEKAAFSGWDFSYIDGRWEHEKRPWDYKKIVLEHLKSTDALLDMGTGGGEFLLTLNHPYELTSVTEGYPPNLELCKQKLGTLGIDVRYADYGEGLPFSDGVFDVVINRHEWYDPTEVKRVLKPGCIFITQQVGGRNNASLSQRLAGNERQIDKSWDLEHAAGALERQGFEILNKQECFPKLKFLDVGALVYFAKVIEWEYPGFSVESCFNELLNLHKVCKEEGYILSAEHRFIIVCRR